jgi:hypothetical protein
MRINGTLMSSMKSILFAVPLLITGMPVQTSLAWDVLNTDMLLSRNWYVIKNDDSNSANEIHIRAYAGQFDNAKGEVVGLTNLLTFTCSKSGHYFNASFPPILQISALAGLQRMEAVQIRIADYDLKEIVTVNGRHSGENSVYFDMANNNETIFDLPEKLQNNLMIFRSRVGETAVNVVSETTFSENVEYALKDRGFVVEKSFPDFVAALAGCLSFTGINFVE